MLPYFWYILKVIICSGILFGYYWLFLRNKIFHQYNRFYLLAALVLSMLLPLLKIDFWQQDPGQSQVIKVLQAVSASDDYMNNVIITANKDNWNIQQLYPVIYWIVSMAFFLVLLQTLFIIRSLLKKYPVQLIDKFSFVNTDDKNTPFSFLKYIFWNTNIDMDTATGKQIFKHEVAHIQEKHTYDKLFVNIILIFFWCNPFFWLYRKELNMIHEFIADKKAVEDSDTASFAAMILQAAYPQHRFQLTNNFFYSPIKRRLLMLTKNNNPKVNYITRVMALPLVVLVFAAFSFKQKTNNATAATKLNIISYIADQPGTITLLNSLLKSSDDTKHPKDTLPNKNNTITLKSSKQPLFILDGVEADSNLLHRLDPSEISSINVIKDKSAFDKYGQRGNNGVIEITLKKNEIANTEQPHVAIALDKFSVLYIGIDNPVTIALPDIPSDRLLVSINNGSIRGSNGKYIVRVTTVGEATIKVSTIKNDQRVTLSTQTFKVKRVPDPTSPDFPSELKYKLDSSRISELKQKYILEHQNLAKLDYAEKQLLAKNADAALEKAMVERKLNDQELQNLKQKLLLEQQNIAKSDYTEKTILYEKELLVQQNNLVFTKVEVSPMFTGGEDAWRKYLEKNLDPRVPLNEGWKAGKYTVIVKFIVRMDGTVSNVGTENYKGTRTARHCIGIIQQAPKWQPAIQNGKNVNAYKKQPITFVIEE